MHPLISITVPTYNQAQYLPITLDALWFQDYPNLEIIVVNAASPDNTREVLEEYEKSVREDEVSYARNFKPLALTWLYLWHRLALPQCHGIPLVAKRN